MASMIKYSRNPKYMREFLLSAMGRKWREDGTLAERVRIGLAADSACALPVQAAGDADGDRESSDRKE